MQFINNTLGSIINVEEDKSRGSLTFFTTYRPSIKTAIFSSPFSPTSEKDEICMTDQVSYNYNGQEIPFQALKSFLQHPKVSVAFPSLKDGVDIGHYLSGLVFVSERDEGLETLHVSIRYDMEQPIVFQFSDLYANSSEVRMEDSACFAGDYLVYVATIHPAPQRRQPWTAVYKTNLNTGVTTRLTPQGQADLSPAVSPSGKKIAVASFERKKNGWDGEIEYQNTNIFVMNIEEPYNRELVVEGGGWPTWGSENVLYFHKLDKDNWGVFRADLSGGLPTPDITPVTPQGIDVITPVAIDETTLAVVTIREKSPLDAQDLDVDQYRHVEILHVTEQKFEPVTKITKPKANHYNPFVIAGSNAETRVGYHRSNIIFDAKPDSGYDDKLESIKSPDTDVELFRVSGAFPSFSPDLSKLAFVDNEFMNLYAVDANKSYIVFKGDGSNTVFGPIWSQNPKKDTLYACMGPAFASKDTDTVDIRAFLNVCTDGASQWKQLTNGSNNAFPYTNPEGTKLVYRSTRDSGQRKYKNLYIIENLEALENGTETEAKTTRLTEGKWVDTQCEWSPSGDWIVFASNRDRPSDDLDHGLDTGYFVVYLVKANDPSVLVRVVGSRSDDFAGHVNHPVFSPDGKTLAVVSDLAAVSCDPISLPHFNHSVRPYGDIFFVDIDPENIENNKDIKPFMRATHSKYENSLAAWTKFSCYKSPAWDQFCDLIKEDFILKIHLPGDGRETRHVSGHLCIAGRKC